MKKDKKNDAFRFNIVEEKDKDVLIEITEEDYRRQIAAGVPEDEMMSVGLHKARRGGFLERHPNFKLEDVEINVTTSPENSPVKNDKDKKAA